LHSVSNPGNLGTVIRTVDAVGGAGVVVIGDTADEFAPAAVKASMGSVFAIRVARAATEEEFFDWAALHDVCVVATSGAAEHDHWHAPYRTPLAVLLGNEGEGLPRSALERADLQVRIPMVGTAESLNLAAAAAITLYEARRNAPDLMEDAGRARASLR
ncbi:TrmH family RNA methyltransferase, partial [Nocardia abscessus]